MPSLDLDDQSFKSSREKRLSPMASQEPVATLNFQPSFMTNPRAPSPNRAPTHKRKKFVLCFDGTGNKFSGTDADSNILKIFRMLDRNDDLQKHYYQPGIGTYVAAKSVSHTSRIDRIKSWYMKSKDAAVGSSFADHCLGGYKFLMRYYSPGDDLYIFGFSRGAYTARFLAEMLDHVGLLSAGNEEMINFAWKTFSKWQTRQETTAQDKLKKKELLEFMMAFRETFSRPVKAIRFLGLFDTVNSVPALENAWMQRSKFPYTARTTAKVIRHAVAIDERRAKFRQDLISAPSSHAKSAAKQHKHRDHLRHKLHGIDEHDGDEMRHEDNEHGHQTQLNKSTPYRITSRATLKLPELEETFRRKSETEGIERLSPNLRPVDARSIESSATGDSMSAIRALEKAKYESDNEEEQDIREVWFAGCHADIGGGWTLAKGEQAPLAHVPLVWMIREAEKAGLKFDGEKLRRLNCWPEDVLQPNTDQSQNPVVPDINVVAASPPAVEVDSPLDFSLNSRTSGSQATPDNTQPLASDSNLISSVLGNDPAKTPAHSATDPYNSTTPTNTANDPTPPPSRFYSHLSTAGTKGHIHDVLQLNNGLPWSSVLSWNIMEHLPFRRMDLQPDGSWKSITWPLPRGETRDIPDDVVIHNSVIRRMEVDPKYRPGNLIVGGGGRGVRIAPREFGTGRWRVLPHGEGDPVSEVYVRDGAAGRSLVGDGRAE